jgi:predicted GTPase
MLPSRKPVVAVTAVRTGCGKSQVNEPAAAAAAAAELDQLKLRCSAGIMRAGPLAVSGFCNELNISISNSRVAFFTFVRYEALPSLLL